MLEKKTKKLRENGIPASRNPAFLLECRAYKEKEFGPSDAVGKQSEGKQQDEASDKGIR